MLAKSNEESKTISIKQAAEKANVSIPTIHNWIKLGKLSAQKQGKSWQIPQASLDLCLVDKPTVQPVQPVLTDQVFSELAHKVVAELKPVLEQAFAIQQSFQAKTTELNIRVDLLEKELAELKQSLAQKPEEKPDMPKETKQPDSSKESQVSQSQVSQSKEESEKQASNSSRMEQKPDEEKAEKWVRENLEKWLDQPCPYGKAMGRSWRELAENRGAKISLKGMESQPRAYLHALENWQQCESVWSKVKAKVALEVVGKDGQGSYRYTA